VFLKALEYKVVSSTRIYNRARMARIRCAFSSIFTGNAMSINPR
jgi:hypothetical protein